MKSGASQKYWDRLTPATARALSLSLSLLAGASAALLFHYVLYRTELPSKPFIYVAF